MDQCKPQNAPWKLTSRQRVLCALDHKEPDRVPLFLGTSGATTVLGPGYDALKRHLGITGGPERWLSRAMQYTWLDEELMIRLGSDGRPIAPARPRRRCGAKFRPTA